MDRTVQKDILDTAGPVLTYIKEIEHIFCFTDGLLRDLSALKSRIISGHSRQKLRIHLGHLRLVIVVFRIQHPVILSDHQHL